MVTKVSEQEAQQLQRTVEMFEAITQSQTDDVQSLEILKEAYTKLGRTDDIHRTAVKMAEAHEHLGHISQAILEYEGLLQSNPQDATVSARLTALQAQLATLDVNQSSGVPATGRDSKPLPSAPVVTTGAEAPRVVLPQTRPDDISGDQALANALLADKLLTPQSVQPLLAQLRNERLTSIAKGQPLTLVQMLFDQQLMKPDDLLAWMLNKSRLPYMPLNIYDVDRDAATLLPKEISFGFCVTPFDMISRSALVVTCNPFDTRAREDVRALLNRHVFWYLAPPADIISALRRAHGMDGKKGS